MLWDNLKEKGYCRSTHINLFVNFSLMNTFKQSYSSSWHNRSFVGLIGPRWRMLESHCCCLRSTPMKSWSLWFTYRYDISFCPAFEDESLRCKCRLLSCRSMVKKNNQTRDDHTEKKDNRLEHNWPLCLLKVWNIYNCISKLIFSNYRQIMFVVSNQLTYICC